MFTLRGKIVVMPHRLSLAADLIRSVATDLPSARAEAIRALADTVEIAAKELALWLGRADKLKSERHEQALEIAKLLTVEYDASDWRHLSCANEEPALSQDCRMVVLRSARAAIHS